MKTVLSKILKSNYEKHALIICSLCFSGMLIGNLSERFRYSELRYLYQFGWITCYILVLTSLIWSLGNSISILKESNYSLRRKLLWTSISLAPILLFVMFMLLAFLQDNNSTDIELSTGEHIAPR